MSEISKNDNFRIVFVSQKLEYPKVMLDTCILVSIDEVKMKQEEERIKLKWFKGRRYGLLFYFSGKSNLKNFKMKFNLLKHDLKEIVRFKELEIIFI